MSWFLKSINKTKLVSSIFFTSIAKTNHVVARQITHHTRSPFTVKFFNPIVSIERCFKNSSYLCSNDDKKSGIEPVEPIKIPKKKTIKNLLNLKRFLDNILFVFFCTAFYIWYQKRKKLKTIEEEFTTEPIEIPNIKTKLHNIDGGECILPTTLTKSLRKFKDFELRNDDIWIITYPKSGTTWVQELVYLIVNNLDFEKAKMNNIDNRVPFFEFTFPGLKQIEEMKSPRIIKTHLPKSLLPNEITKKSKVIYVVRNPKDVCVSYYHFSKMITEAGFDGNFSEFVLLFIAGKIPYGAWWSHVNNYLDNKEDIHLVFYEDLITKPTETIKNLGKFVGKDISDEEAHKLKEWCSFANMKSNPKTNYDWYKEYGFFKKEGTFYRKGEIGDWLNYFNPTNSKLFDEIINKNLKHKLELNYGISKDDLEKAYIHYQNTMKNDSQKLKEDEK